MRRADWILIAVLTIATATWCLTASRQLGATFDEPFYFEGGLDYWRHGHFGRLLAAGVMPLPSHLQTLPIYLAERSAGRPLMIEHDLGEMLALARPVTLLFWIVLLVSSMRLGRLWGGPWGGRAAALIVALEPNLLAHATLATTDIALAAFLVAFTAQWLHDQGSAAVRRIALPALWFGLALAAKVSALAFFPFIAAIVLIHAGTRAWRRIAADAIAILAGGLIFATLYAGTGGETFLTTTLSTMAGDDWRRPFAQWIGSQPIFPNALYAIWFQLIHNVDAQPVFIAGRASADPIWYYMPLLAVIKLSLPLLIAAVAAMAAIHSRVRALTIGSAMLVAAMAVFRVQTGIRLLFPLLVIAIVWIAAQLPGLWAHRGALFKPSISVLAAWMVFESMLAWPDGLRYVNEAWGGPDAGYRAVSDSNYDWGQGLPELAEWRAQRGVDLAVWYFGTDTRFPEMVRYNPRIDRDNSKLAGRVLAVSTSMLYGGYLETPDAARTLIEQLRAETPVARTPTFSIFSERR